MTDLEVPRLASLALDKSVSSSSSLSKYDYIEQPFSGKKDQYEQVLDILDSTGFIPENLIESQAQWFYNHLGIDDVFFARELAAEIAGHIHSLYSCKVQAFATGAAADKPLIQYKREGDDHAVVFETTPIKGSVSARFEEEIDDKYIDPSSLVDNSYRQEFFSAPLNYAQDPILAGIAEKTSSARQLFKCHFVYKNKYPEANVSQDETDIAKIGDLTFLKIASENTKKLYSEIIADVTKTTGPVIRHFPISDSDEYRVVIGYRQKTSSRYNSALSDLANYYKLTTTRKYVEQFANGITIISMYVTSSGSHHNPVDLLIYQVIKEASLLYCIPHNLFHHRFVRGELSLQESIYAQCGVIFVTHFLNRLGPEYTKLSSLLDPSKLIQHAEVLNSLKKRLRAETYTQNYIHEVFDTRKEIVRKLYRQFADVHYIRSSMEKTLSYQRLSQITPVGNEQEFEELLNRECSQNEHHIFVLKALYKFNQAILKTNFFVLTKVALSFRLNPDFLPTSEYPDTPFGMFFIVGNDFRGFHIRFRDIARGGIRIVKSRSDDAYNANLRNLFDENYNLASTQQRKNKDIPEGGSKGVILLDPGAAQERPRQCFEKYVDSLIDLLLNQPIPGVKDAYVDLYNKPEILFLGPDEGTAGYVDWATLHARSRGAPWWRSFLTGKSPQLGGIPHDEYGMTTLSVRAYVNKIYEELGISNQTVNKIQTGGPDGDLGSNEIKLSSPNENYIAIVDGSGVIVDPQGLNKQELLRLAGERVMIDHFDKSLLSKDGYVVLVDDVDITLPSGQKVTSGVAFRNQFHVQFKHYVNTHIDVFVPCGGRPGAIDTNNVHELIDSKTGKAIIPYFVEGANLFITQSAKLILESAGTIIFKDASTNKGGVTSSSAEVLAALSFDDEGFLSNMCVDASGNKPALYQKYVKQVQDLIVRNAQLEFQGLWSLNKQTGAPITTLSDKLSVSINSLADELAGSKELWNDDVEFRNAVLTDALPDLLLSEIGIDHILKRVPEPYLRALFATHLASRFVYSRGIDANPAKFLEFISSTRKSYVKQGLLN